MAKIRLKCTCGKTLVVDDKFAGKIGKCPACQRPFQVPEPTEEAGPAEAEAGDMGETITSLSDAYGEAVLARARRERMQAALAEYEKKARKKKLVIGGSILAVLLVAFLGWRLTRTIGPPVGDPADYPEAVRPFLHGLNEFDPLVRAAATWEIADANPAELPDILWEMLEDPDPVVRLVAARSLSRVAPGPARERLKPLLEDPELDLRMTAAFAIADSAEESARQAALAETLNLALAAESDWAEWFSQVSAGEIEEEDAAERLDKGMRSPAVWTRAVTAWMVAATLGADQRLLQLLRDPDERVKRSAIRALAPLVTAEALGRVRRAGATEAYDRRMTALTNLERRIRAQGRRKRKREPVGVRRAAAVALAANGQDSRAPLFRPGLSDEDWFVRFASAKGLERLDPAAALPVLEVIPAPEHAWVRRVVDRIGAKAENAEEPEGSE
jgi:HEAT repeat protein